MYIESVEVKGFGKLRNRNIVLKKGVNIIFGSNEAGKSTLQSFIKSMLFGVKSSKQSRNGFIQPQKKFAPWFGEQYGGSMNYILDDGRWYRVERDFEKDELLIFDSSYNNITSQFSVGRDKQPMFAESQLGIDEETFKRTALIKQMGVRIGGGGSEALAEKLANVSSTGAEEISFSKAEKALKEALTKNIGTERTTVQPLNKLEARLQQLQEKRDRYHNQQEQRLLSLQELQKIQSRHVRLNFKLKYLEHIGDLIELRELLDSNLKKEACLKDALRELRELEAAVNTNKPPQEQEAILRRRQRSTGKKLNMVSYFCLAAAIIFSVLLVYAAMADGAGSSIEFAFAYGGGLLLSIIGFLLFCRKKPKGTVSGSNDSDGQREAEAAEAATAAANIEGVLKRTSLLYDENFISAANIQESISKTVTKLENLSIQLDEGIARAGTMEVYYTGAFKKEELETVIYDSDIEDLKTGFQDETERVQNGLMDSALKEKYYQGLLEDTGEESDQWQQVVEEIENVKGKIAELRYKGDALKLAHEVLVEAGTEIKRTFAPGLNTRMSSIIKGLTEGRYADLRGDDKLSLMVTVPESGDVKSVHTLSGAAGDQMYLALRLAMLETVTEEGESLPILMDEVFSQFDDKRTALALEYINSVYQKKQVLIFTCKRREVEIAMKICGSNLNRVEL